MSQCFLCVAPRCLFPNVTVKAFPLKAGETTPDSETAFLIFGLMLTLPSRNPVLDRKSVLSFALSAKVQTIPPSSMRILFELSRYWSILLKVWYWICLGRLCQSSFFVG